MRVRGEPGCSSPNPRAHSHAKDPAPFGIAITSEMTLSKDRASGKFSAEKRPDGSYRVSLSELIRAYGDRLQRRTEGTGADNTTAERLETPR